LQVLDGLGHLPQVEDSDRVVAELRRFLDDLP
jgi:pimeloyl-ACP methyl ester carboxylesterase